jgi:hypothetical protein
MFQMAEGSGLWARGRRKKSGIGAGIHPGLKTDTPAVRPYLLRVLRLFAANKIRVNS